ncbi:MAG: 4-(cytidine 5'-diphospho)-2-C-methyl-D-erythritol kinase [Syntrophobacterales bacterium]|nr:4-(cytidine 5'-diphospho)-2-C-methyl-D-erythritol kinase [Syntrophobacterales bacterium]
MKLSCASPAKVNLMLKVLSKREDGYHNLFSVVDVISLYDILHIKEEPSGKVIVKDDRGLLPEGEQNTVFRAATLLRKQYGITRGVKIFIEKNIPIGSGLGGPSSNAATTLKALNMMWELQINDDVLMGLGAEIGADVPLFIHGGSCLMEGIGERITPVSLPRLWYLVVYPDTILSTAEVYKRLKIVLTKGENDIKLTGNLATAYDVSRILENDLEKVGTLICPTIKNVKARLMDSGSVGALMSGSGSSVFGIFENEEKARNALKSLEGMGSLFVTHSI